MSTEQPQPNTARARGERSGPQRPPGTVRRSMAIAVAITNSANHKAYSQQHKTLQEAERKPIT